MTSTRAGTGRAAPRHHPRTPGTSGPPRREAPSVDVSSGPPQHPRQVDPRGGGEAEVAAAAGQLDRPAQRLDRRLVVTGQLLDPAGSRATARASSS